MRVFIADDHAVVREGLKHILSEEISGLEFGEAVRTPEVLDGITTGDWDVVVLDLNLPGRSGIDLLKDIKAARPELPILVLGSDPNDQFAIRTLRAGASGYLNNKAAPRELCEAVRKAAGGGRWVSAALAERLAASLDANRSPEPPHERLSDRELQIMRLLAVGKPVKEIAGDLFLSVKTVSTYRRRVLEKMALRTNADLTRYAIENQMEV